MNTHGLSHDETSLLCSCMLLGHVMIYYKGEVLLYFKGRESRMWQDTHAVAKGMCNTVCHHRVAI